jgi:16S rRNA (guanine(966)-N(2))-methyltransferase RsmD
MRIVAGALGGRRLVAPKDQATRPTSEKVREALFSILGPIGGAKVLDLYAGTGALGLEALSRGASQVVFVEERRPALVSLAENLAALGVGAETLVVSRPVERCRASIAAHFPFDLVLADPPYADIVGGQAIRAVEGLLEGLLAPGGRLVVEHSSQGEAPSLAGLARRETRRYGDTCLSFFA